jgi:hypothetical protein
MSIADTGRFWEILVIRALQILEDSGKYSLYTALCASFGRSVLKTDITDAQTGQK